MSTCNCCLWGTTEGEQCLPCQLFREDLEKLLARHASFHEGRKAELQDLQWKTPLTDYAPVEKNKRIRRRRRI